MGIGQTEETKIWVLARPNRRKYGYRPDRKMGIQQTEQTKIAIDGRRDPNFFQTFVDGRTGPPLRDPSRSGPYLSWVADFILGTFILNNLY